MQELSSSRLKALGIKEVAATNKSKEALTTDFKEELKEELERRALKKNYLGSEEIHSKYKSM